MKQHLPSESHNPGESHNPAKTGNTGNSGNASAQSPLSYELRAEGEHPSMTRAEFLRLALAAAVAAGAGLSPAAQARPGNPSGVGNAISPGPGSMREARKEAPAAKSSASAKEGNMLTRVIPSSGERLGVIGCGTWQTFDVGPGKEEREPLAEVLRTLFAAGGSVVDSSPMYGRSEAVVGELLTQIKAHDKAFVATKVWTSGRDAGIRQMRESMALLQTPEIELMQIHNLLDWRTHLKTLRAWKEEGKIRYLGITHYTPGAFAELEAIMRKETPDFVQMNFSLDDRAAEKSLLSLAAERGIAVLVNRPFGGGSLLRDLQKAPLPGWAPEIGCETWAQVLLKYVVSHPSVTCAIPGTSRPRHMADNAKAGTGPMPDAAMRRRMAQDWDKR